MSSKSSIQNIFKLSIPIFFANLVIPFVAIVDTGLMGNLDNGQSRRPSATPSPRRLRPPRGSMPRHHGGCAPPRQDDAARAVRPAGRDTGQALARSMNKSQL